jgi:peptidoglycan/LPS O-acetylase OafA/YrhL
LETRGLKFIGRISYSLYLWQQAFFPLKGLGPQPHDNLLTFIQHSWLRYAVLPLVAVASYQWIERPMIRLGHRLAHPVTPGREDVAEPAKSPITPLAI